MRPDIAAMSVALFVALEVVQVRPGAAAEQVSVTSGPAAIQVNNRFVHATLSAERLHLVGLKLAGMENLNLLERVATSYHAGHVQWQHEDRPQGYSQWETKLARRQESLVALAQASDASFQIRRAVKLPADAPYLEVRYELHCTRTFRTGFHYAIPEISFARELDEATWEGTDGRMEKVLALENGKASSAWEQARGKYVPALAVGGHWFAARSAARDEGLLVFLPAREGVVARVSTGYPWRAYLQFAIAPAMGRRPNPPMPGDIVASRFFLMPFRGAPEEAAKQLVKLLNWRRPTPARPSASPMSHLLATTPALTLWHEAPVVKVMRNHRPPGGEARPTIEPAAAKDEYEATQIAASTERGLRDVRLTAGDLRGPAGMIPSACVEINPVGYVQMAAPPGEIPDILLPNRKVDLQPGRVQPFWVTVHVPRDTPAGRYEGALKFAAQDLDPIDVSFRLAVYDFALPQERHLRAPFGFRQQYLAAPYGSEQS